MPTFIVFKDGQKVGELTGANPSGLRALVDKAAAVAS
jgi:thioredoxin 1